MNSLEAFIKSQAKEKSLYPDVKPGAVVRIHQKFIEVAAQAKSKKQAKAKEAEKTKERMQIFEGLVIARRGKSHLSTITIRKVSDGIGVEYILPLDLPSIKKIETVKQNKIRRAKLYYLRKRTGKAVRFKEVAVKSEAKKEAKESKKEMAAEAK
jgi:large subunit ribosomal protein L19